MNAELLNRQTDGLHNLVEDVARRRDGRGQCPAVFSNAGALLITPGDREDIILAARTSLDGPKAARRMAGIVLTGDLRPSAEAS